jgi:hypothetical protein
MPVREGTHLNLERPVSISSIAQYYNLEDSLKNNYYENLRTYAV